MNTPTELEAILRQAVEESLFKGFDFKTYFLENRDLHVYAIVTSSLVLGKRSLVAYLARIEDDKIIIEVDTSDRSDIPLYKALMSKGVPREKMVLTYLGEQDPDKYHHQE